MWELHFLKEWRRNSVWNRFCFHLWSGSTFLFCCWNLVIRLLSFLFSFVFPFDVIALTSWLSWSLPPALPHLHLVVLPIKAVLFLSSDGPSTFSLGGSVCLFSLSSWCFTLLLLPCCSRWQLLPVGHVNEETSKSKGHRRLLLLTFQKPSD